MTFVSFDMTTIRIRKRLGWIFADCTQPGCHWAQPWPLYGEWRLDQVLEAAAGHSCANPNPSEVHP